MRTHSSPERDRRRLRLLDACLHELEEANERQESFIVPELAARLRPHVPTIVPGMPITDGIELVLREQEPCLANMHGGELVPADSPVPAWAQRGLTCAGYENGAGAPLDEPHARALTEEIKSATRRVCLLLLEAHQRRAWIALGYRSWDEYVAREFGLSRSRSYELLDQGWVIGTIRAVAGITEIPDISAYAAGQIKSHLPVVIEEVRRRVRDVPRAETIGVVNEVLRDQRARLADQRRQLSSPRRTTSGGPANGGAEELIQAIDCLTRRPVVEAIAVLARHDLDGLDRVDHAIQWLTEFAEGWSKHRATRRAAPAPAGVQGEGSR